MILRTHRRPLVSFLTLAPTLTLAGFGLAVAGTPPAVAAPAPPQLSIQVDDGRTETRAGETLRYAITVTNLGRRPVRNLVVSSTVPANATLGTYDRRARRSASGVSWTIDLAAGEQRTVRSSITVKPSLPGDLLRLATVACAATSAKTAPLVCASDSDQLPAGALAVQQQRELAAPLVQTPPVWRSAWALVTCAAAGAVLVVGGVLLTRRGSQRRERARRAAEPG